MGKVHEDKIYLDWFQIEGNVDTLITNLKLKNLGEYDTILGIARGGVIPATIIAYKLDCHNLQQLGVRTRDVKHTQFYGTPQLAGRVLVVDDINDSGKTFTEVEEYIKYHFDHNEVESVHYVSIVKRYNTAFNENETHGILCPDDDWFVFPWDDG